MLHAILVPYHLGRSRVGSGSGPEALVNDGVLDGLPVAATTTIDIADSASHEIHRSIAVTAAIAIAARAARNAGATPLVLSGNCHACLGSLSALPADKEIIWFDAHGDLNTPETTRTGYFDGMALATALGSSWTQLIKTIPEFAPADERRTVLVGGRDLDPEERERLDRSAVRHYLPPALADADLGFDAQPALAGSSAAYIHLDLDVLDPSELHANQFAAPGGVSVRWLEAALRSLRRRHAIAAVGVSAYDPAYAAPAAAAPIVNRLLKALFA
jgi:arginase